MPTADPEDPASLERAYPLAAFERDAARNALPAATELHGVRIGPAAGGEGVELACVARHAGETAASDDVLFLVPHRADGAVTASDGQPGYGGPQPGEGPSAASTRQAYEAFLARIAETVRNARFQPPIGLGEERLKGLRGG